MKRLLQSFLFFTSVPDLVSYKIIIPIAVVDRSAYGDVRTSSFDVVVRKTVGTTITDIASTSAMTANNLSLKIKKGGGSEQPWLISDEIGSIEMFDGFTLLLYLGAKLIEELVVPVVTEQPFIIPHTSTTWSSSLTFRNGEYIIYDTMVYVWSYPKSGNSTINPKADMQNNPLTTRWKAYTRHDLLVTNMMIAAYGCVGDAVFKDSFMFSKQGVDASGAVTSDYTKFGTSAFNPNILLDFLTGKSKLKDAEIEGKITAHEGLIGGMEIVNNTLRGTQAILGNYVQQITASSASSKRSIIVDNIDKQQTYCFGIRNVANDIIIDLPSAHDLLLKGIEAYSFELTIMLDHNSPGSAVMLKPRDDAKISLKGTQYSSFGVGCGHVVKLLYLQNNYYVTSWSDGLK